MTGLVGSILLLKAVEDIADTQTVTAYLVGIRRTDALAGSTYLILTLLCLVGSIEHAVGRHDEVSLLRNMKTLLQFVSTGLQRLSFLHEEVGSQYDAITNDVDLTTLEYSRGY